MHPIISEKKRLLIYLFIWVILGTLSGFILSSLTGGDILYTIVFSIPALLVYAEMNLSAWYVCRAFPIERTHIWRLLAISLASVIFISVLNLYLFFSYIITNHYRYYRELAYPQALIIRLLRP